VAALVQPLTAARSLQPLSMAAHTAPLLTLWQEQMVALSGRHRRPGRRATALRQDQRGRVGRQGNAVLGVLQQGVVIAVVAHQHRAEHMLAAGVHHQPAVGALASSMKR
jgi:hypothetical protein